MSTNVPTPTPSTFTLRLKNGATTTFLYAAPTTTLRALKSELFALLCENAAHLSVPLPEAAERIVLGLPRDQADLARGGYLRVDEGKGKKMATLLDAGIADGSVLVWRDGEGAEFRVEVPREDEGESQA